MAGAQVVDAHHHIWDPADAPDAYRWLSGPYASIHRPFGPADLAPSLAAAGVNGTVLVQTRSSLDESRQYLSIAAKTRFIRGVVAWVDLASPEIGDQLDALAAGSGGDRLVGIRHQVHDEPDAEWLGRADVRRGLAEVARRGLVYDLLLRPRELPAGLDVARAMPDLAFVIDHIAKPSIASGAREPWASQIAPFAGLANVSCKLSGMVTEADHASWSVVDLRPYADHVLSVFGPERLMFGSDWPVCLVAASYERVVSATRELIDELSPGEKVAVMGGTAERAYSLSP